MSQASSDDASASAARLERPAPMKGTMMGAAISPEAIAAARAAQAAPQSQGAPPPAPPSSGGVAGPTDSVPKGTMLGAAVSPETIAAARAAASSPEGAAAPARVPASRTMLGIAATAAPVGSPVAPAAPASDPEHSWKQATSPEVPIARGRTMLGVAAPPSPNAGAAPAPDPAAGRVRPGATMLGVAMPGIAPIAPGVATTPPQAPGGRIAAGGTMMGVAIPGIAPSQSPPGASPGRLRVAHTAMGDVLPAPAPFVDDIAPPTAPVRRAKSGVPIAVVVAIVAGLVLVGGVLIVLLKPSAAPLTGQPRLDAQGNQLLHLQCENCPDGTVVSLEATKATFKAKEADLPLPKPLLVGENNLVLAIDRPGAGRDEEVKLAVPLGFYVRADLSAISAKPPVITVRVAAAPGSQVTVDGKPLALDASGNGAYALDVTSDTEGATEDVKVIDRKIPYVVTLKGGAPQSGTVNARIAVVPLRLDEPSVHAVIDTASLAIAGQTAAGATITIDGQPATAQADGSFAETRTASPGEAQVELRATAPGRAPRTVHLSVKRVASLPAEAKEVEATPLATYDQIASDIASRVGQRAVLAGEVIEARVSGHQTIALLNSTRGCASGSCLARVVAAEDAKLARGAAVRVYGSVTRAVTTSNGKTIPEIEADFVVPGKR